MMNSVAVSKSARYMRTSCSCPSTAGLWRYPKRIARNSTEQSRQKYLDERSADNGDFSYDMLTTDEFSGEDILIADQPDVCDTVVESIMTDKLRKAILKLTDEEQLLIYRHYYAGISGTDLAEIYGVSQQAISKRIAKIRAKLKNLLEN